jgi:four helix bundle protein
MKINSFREILAWQKAHLLVLEVYKITEAFPKVELYCLVPQIRRAVVSIPSNIAEGFKRRGKKDSVHFYNIAEGSLEEVKYQLLLSKDLEYISNSDYDRLNDQADEAGRVLCGWLKSQLS